MGRGPSPHPGPTLRRRFRRVARTTRIHLFVTVNTAMVTTHRYSLVTPYRHFQLLDSLHVCLSLHLVLSTPEIRELCPFNRGLATRVMLLFNVR